jgi:branched-chain amino acid transport system permease protein
MQFELFLQYFISGLTYGSIYAAVAIGFNIIYNATGIINFAQGEFAMLGGMIASVLSSSMPLALAVAIAVLASAAVGVIVERLLLRRIARFGVLKMIIATVGISIVLRETALLLWGESVKTVPFFTGNEVSSVSLLGAHFSPQVFWILGTIALIAAALSVFFKLTMTGKAMRACSANREGSSLCGISPGRMVALAFGMSAAIGALGGCVVAPLTQTHYAVGAPLAIKGFTVAAFGGLGNSVAAIAAGMLLGMLESFSIVLVPEAYKDVVTIAVLLTVLVAKPTGLFSSRASGALKAY